MVLFIFTLPETNIAPENGWLEDVISSWEGLFPGAMLVSGRVFFLGGWRAVKLQGCRCRCRYINTVDGKNPALEVIDNRGQ